LIEGNRTSGSIIEHGIYVSNSGDRPIIRGNVVWNNSRNGIHMNGDAEQGGDGVISDAVVEANTIYSNGADGGSAINCDGVQDSLIVNNLIYDTHASGISLYRIDGGAPSTGNLIVNNTVIVASNGRWALNIMNDSSGNAAYNNIFFNLHASRGGISLCGPGCAEGFVSDYNITLDRFTADDGSVLSIADWRAATGQDAHSVVCDPNIVFVDAAMNDYRVSENSAARDVGTSLNAPLSDHDGNARPAGGAIDIGAFEYCGDGCKPAPATGGNPTVGGASQGGSSARPIGGTATGGTGPAVGGSPASAGAAQGGASSSAGGPTSGAAGSILGAPGSDGEAGCSCRVTGGRASSAWALASALALFGLRRRRVARGHTANGYVSGGSTDDQLLVTSRGSTARV
jgi:MYXO-CTERM domain-containing protein